MVATDGSERAMKAVRKSLELAEKEGADITLLSVGYYFRSEIDEMPVDIQESLDAEYRAPRSKRLKPSLMRRGVRVNTLLEKGLVPANVILEVAEGANSIIFCWAAPARRASRYTSSEAPRPRWWLMHPAR